MIAATAPSPGQWKLIGDDSRLHLITNDYAWVGESRVGMAACGESGVLYDSANELKCKWCLAAEIRGPHGVPLGVDGGGI